MTLLSTLEVAKEVVSCISDWMDVGLEVKSDCRGVGGCLDWGSNQAVRGSWSGNRSAYEKLNQEVRRRMVWSSVAVETWWFHSPIRESALKR